ncbi:MAG: carbohydrate ABC transporter permease [Solirubrobacteraceae bacterium]|jgi:multiple sugar transport system permease protein
MNRRTHHKLAASAGKHAVLILVSVVLGFPLLWMVLTSLKTNQQALAVPPVWIPHPFLWSNYPNVISAVTFPRFVLNTLMYAASTIVGVCISSSLVAYGFSRIRWRGRDFLFKVMVSTLLIPFFATLIPLFVMYKNFHMVGWYLPLIVPTFLGSSIFSTFLLRQFFMTLPQSVSDAARMDGANEFTIFTRVILPMSKPALATVILFQFVYCWNDYLGPLIYIDNQVWYPVSLGLTLVLGTYTTNWPWVMAAATAATLPIVILFFFAQRTFIAGISIQGTGDKG